jgi:uncharacterized membrane protein
VTVDAALLPGWLIATAAVLMAAALAVSLRFAPWRALLAAPERQHVLLGGTVGLSLLWLGDIEVSEGIRIHLLAVTCTTMIIGLPLTLVAGALALAAQLALQQQSLLALPVAWLPSVAIPAVLTRLLVQWLRRRAPRQLFLYLLGAGFGGGMASVLASAASALLLLALMGRFDLIDAALGNATLLALMMFPEGFLNGMLITAVTVFRPGLVKTFDDTFYLDG